MTPLSTAGGLIAALMRLAYLNGSRCVSTCILFCIVLVMPWFRASPVCVKHDITSVEPMRKLLCISAIYSVQCTPHRNWLHLVIGCR